MICSFMKGNLGKRWILLKQHKTSKMFFYGNQHWNILNFMCESRTDILTQKTIWIEWDHTGYEFSEWLLYKAQVFFLQYCICVREYLPHSFKLSLVLQYRTYKGEYEVIEILQLKLKKKDEQLYNWWHLH